MNDFIIDTLKTMLTLLGVAFTDISVTIDEKTSSPRFVIATPDSSILIGEHGARLLAINHLMKRIVEKKFPGEHHSFMVDVNDYQKKQVEDIRTKAHMLAERARYFKSSVEMDPMSSYERMIVHAEFTMTPDIMTESSGFGKERHLVLKYTETKVLPNTQN
jgi:spoIIIJ-associated protein